MKPTQINLGEKCRDERSITYECRLRLLDRTDRTRCRYLPSRCRAVITSGTSASASFQIFRKRS
jgi:hypothetical protein